MLEIYVEDLTEDTWIEQVARLATQNDLKQLAQVNGLAQTGTKVEIATRILEAMGPSVS